MFALHVHKFFVILFKIELLLALGIPIRAMIYSLIRFSYLVGTKPEDKL